MYGVFRLDYLTEDECRDGGIAFDTNEPHPRLIEAVCELCFPGQAFRGEPLGRWLAHYDSGGYWINPVYDRKTNEASDMADPYYINDREVWELVAEHFNDKHDGIPADLDGPLSLSLGFEDHFGALRLLAEYGA